MKSLQKEYVENFFRSLWWNWKKELQEKLQKQSMQDFQKESLEKFSKESKEDFFKAIPASMSEQLNVVIPRCFFMYLCSSTNLCIKISWRIHRRIDGETPWRFSVNIFEYFSRNSKTNFSRKLWKNLQKIFFKYHTGIPARFSYVISSGIFKEIPWRMS